MNYINRYIGKFQIKIGFKTPAEVCKEQGHLFQERYHQRIISTQCLDIDDQARHDAAMIVTKGNKCSRCGVSKVKATYTYGLNYGEDGKGTITKL